MPCGRGGKRKRKRKKLVRKGSFNGREKRMREGNLE